jgi:hypothetical protein
MHIDRACEAAMLRSLFSRKTTVTGVEARQGFLDRPVLAVLVISLGLVAVAFAAILMNFV